MIVLLLAQLSFPLTGGAHIRVDGGRWDLEVSYRDTAAIIGETVILRHSIRRVVRDYAYYGYPPHYDAMNPLAAPGDTVDVFLTGPRVITGAATFPLDSVLTLLADTTTGDTLSTGALYPPFTDTTFVTDTFFVIRPQPGDSLLFQGQVRLFAGGMDSLIVSGVMTVFSDSLVFPQLLDSVVIDTIGLAHAFDASGPAHAFGFNEGGNRGRSGRYGLDRGPMGHRATGTGHLSLGFDVGLGGGMANGWDTRHDQRSLASRHEWDRHVVCLATWRERFVNGTWVRTHVSHGWSASLGDVFGHVGDTNGRVELPVDYTGRRGGYVGRWADGD